MWRRLVLLLLVGMTVVPAASAQTELSTKAKKRVVIRDSTNKPVGILIDTGIGTCPTNACCNAPTIALEVQDVIPGVDETCSLYVCRDTLMGTDVIYFEAADCSGQPLLPFASNSVTPATAIDARSSKLSMYVAHPTASSQAMDLGSYVLDSSCVQVEATFEVIPAVFVSDLRTKFIPPFRLD
jgi:hypothetical protein